MRQRLIGLAVAVLVMITGCQSAQADRSAGSACQPGPANDLVPADGIYLGANIDWGSESLRDYADRLGARPSVAVSFTRFPFTPADERNVDGAAEQLRGNGGLLLLTLEPHGGLAAVTDDVAADLARRLAVINRRGVPVVVRFAHEMNGSWYAWGQQPAAYIAAFRRVAGAVHSDAPGSATMWAPNYGGGHPFTGGAYAATPGSVDARLLDTDGDGVVSAADDPYAPYWPGDDAVDWVGMSLYHWGSAYPWGENEIPEPGKFVAQLTGDYVGLGGDDRALPDFYRTYGEQYGKPVGVPETAALYLPGRGGAEELAVKRAWWRQVLDPALHRQLPRLAMINWFEWDKPEPEVGARVAWTATVDADLRAAYRADLPDWARWAGAPPRCGN